MRTGDLLRQLLRSGTGRAGVALLLFLVLLSAYVLTAYPQDFGSRVWSDPAAWADYPKAVPPAWADLVGGQRLPRHTILSLEGPISRTSAGTAEVLLYRARWEHSSLEPPTFLSLTLGQMAFQAAPPQLTLSLLRPDGREVLLYRHVVRGPRPGEAPPFSRYQEAPFRILLSGEPAVAAAVGQFVESGFGARPPDSLPPGFVQEALFGVPVGEGSSAFRGLSGIYEVRVRVVVSPEDVLGPIRFVAGGSVYGLMGTDTVGRDLIQGLLFGIPVALVIGIGAALLTTFIGASLGIASGYLGGWADTIIQRAADIVSNIPVLPLLIFLVFVLGSRLYLIILVLVAFSWPGLTILLRSMVLQLRSGQLIEAEVTLGASPWRIMARHIFPQTAPFVFAQLVFLVPGAILAEAALSFLGLGDASIPTWGQILEQGFRTGGVYVGYWWWVVPPGLLIVLTAVIFIFLALGMEQVMNPRLRRPL